MDPAGTTNTTAILFDIQKARNRPAQIDHPSNHQFLIYSFEVAGMQRSFAISTLSGLVQSRFRFVNPRYNIRIISRQQCFLPQHNLVLPSGRHAFSSSALLYKKKSKKGAPAEPEVTKSSNGAEISGDPLDLSRLQDDIAAAVSRLKDDLSKLRAGGRLNTEAIEGLRVQLSKGSKDSVRLGELAQVVPKGGRMVTILAAEDDVS